MEINPMEKAGLVTRVVETVERDGKPAKVVVAARTYATSVDDLWDAITNIDRIPRWFTPVTGDLRLGGRFQLEGNASGEILECEPPRHLEITWEYGGDVSWVTVDLSGDPAGEETHLELRHTAHVPPEFWDAYGPGAVGVGWDLSLMGLGLHLSTGDSVDPAEAEEWATSPQGRVFVDECSATWADAAVADGADRHQADGWRQRVTAFYTTAEE
jgi:uncharacterized protein YndB with AHSA1/START domain